MPSQQFSYFFLRGYFQTNEEVLRIISALNVRHYAFIKHDKDVYTDDSETHIRGQPKKEHYHILLNLTAHRSWKAIRTDILRLNGDCGIWCHDLQNSEQAYLYLTHSTEKSQQEEGKFQYSSANIIEDKKEYFLSKSVQEEVRQEHIDYISEFYFTCLSKGGYTAGDIQYYASLYGRDFIFNFPRVLQAVSYTLNKDIKELFL